MAFEPPASLDSMQLGFVPESAWHPEGCLPLSDGAGLYIAGQSNRGDDLGLFVIHPRRGSDWPQLGAPGTHQFMQVTGMFPLAHSVFVTPSTLMVAEDYELYSLWPYCGQDPLPLELKDSYTVSGVGAVAARPIVGAACAIVQFDRAVMCYR